MMDLEAKKAIRARLRRIAGQVQAVERMADADRRCIELMHQLDAVQAAIGKVGELVLRSHVKNWVADARRDGDEHEYATQGGGVDSRVWTVRAHPRAGSEGPVMRKKSPVDRPIHAPSHALPPLEEAPFLWQR